MFALGIWYLNGWVTASEVSNRDRVEWPPHPGRVFMALAAAHFQGSSPKDEQEALEWLESLEPPQILAAGCKERPAVKNFVPVNDKAGPAKGTLQSASGLTRNRQERTFARAWLENENVFLIWPNTSPPSEAIAEGISKVCDRVTRIGHSTSFVQMRVVKKTENPKLLTWIPNDDQAQQQFRIPVKGTLNYLRDQYNSKAREEYGIRPTLSSWKGYALGRDEASDSASGTVFDPNPLILRLTYQSGDYHALGLVSILRMTSLLRKALLQNADELGVTLPEEISGHKKMDRGTSEVPHLAMLPLAFVGSEYADGRLMGLALSLPRGLSADNRRILLRCLAKTRELKLGPLGVWRLDGITQDRPPINLQAHSWTASPKGATEWGTITPIVLDRHPKAKDTAQYREEMAIIIQTACDRVLLPETSRPVYVAPLPISPHLGVPPSHTFPRLGRKSGGDCRHTHALIMFEKPIVGPLFVGAGRYRGYGFCRPINPSSR